MAHRRSAILSYEIILRNRINVKGTPAELTVEFPSVRIIPHSVAVVT